VKRSLALFGAVAVMMLTVTIMVTLSRAMLTTGGRAERCGVASVVVQCASECRPKATKLENANTNGAAQQNTRTTSAVMRSIGRWLATSNK
jgi:hypothetical protein